MRHAVAKVLPPFGLDNSTFSLYHALHPKFLTTPVAAQVRGLVVAPHPPLFIRRYLFYSMISAPVAISVGQGWGWFVWLMRDGPDHFFGCLPGGFVAVRPGDRPRFGNRDGDGAPDDRLHGPTIPGLCRP